MPMFLIQSAILIAIAFVIGCILGCLLRRWFGADSAAVPAAAASSPKSETSPAAEPGPEPVKAPNPAPLRAAAVPQTVSEPKAAGPAGTAIVNAAAAKTAAAPDAKAIPVKAPSAASKAIAKPAAAPKQKTGKKPMAAKLAAPKGGKPDNLTLINGIGNVIEKRLQAMGVFHFEQIASWTKAEAEEFSRAVGFPGRAEREGWMKESALFAKGGATEHSRKVEAGAIPTSRKSTAAEKASAGTAPKKK